MKNVKIKISIIVLIAIVIMLVSTVVLATPPKIEAQYGDGTDKIISVSGVILGVVQVTAIAIASIILVVIAIKYISASPSEKAGIKQTAILYVFGAVLLFAGAGILDLVQNFAGDIEGAITGNGGSSSGTVK